ncbi:MAG: putative sulfate exporter family transporter [Pseudomonadota bacterium]
MLLIQRYLSLFKSRYPGTLACVALALAATFVSTSFGGPQLLYALLLGLAFHFLKDLPRVSEGVNFCARTLLRLGVALLGARITVSQVANLGISSALTIMVAVALTIACGFLLARWMRRPVEEGLLSGGAVAICGASAALALSSALPQTKENERFTLLAVVGVTIMSTLCMILYPFFLKLIEMPPAQGGIFIGGTIHDVAQVVAAGMMLGPQAGDTATVVKLFRVLLLMPVVLLVSISYRNHPAVKLPDEEVPLVPSFLLAFVVLVLLGSVGMFTPAVTQAASDASRWLLVTAIAASGIKTNFADLLKLGWQPVAMLVGETIFIAAFVLAAIVVLKLGL